MARIPPSSEDLNPLGSNAAKKPFKARISFNVSESASASALGISTYCHQSLRKVRLLFAVMIHEERAQLVQHRQTPRLNSMICRRGASEIFCSWAFPGSEQT